MLFKTADHPDAHPPDRIRLLNRMSAILVMHIPYRDIREYQQGAAQMLAEHHPPGLAVVCGDYHGLEMIAEAEGFVTRRYGTQNAALILSRWCRRAAEGRAYPPAALRVPKPSSMPFTQSQRPEYPYQQPEPAAVT